MSELPNNAPNYSTEPIPFWRDGRILGVLAQIIFVVFFAWAASSLFSNVSDNLDQLGPAQFVCRTGSEEAFALRCAFDFLASEAQFDISESPIEYETSDSYWTAIGVGVLNTLKASFIGILLATILGTLTGIARLSENWLVRNIAKWYIDIMRNTPLLLILFFLYFAYLLVDLPAVEEAISIAGLPIYISQRGVNIPKLVTLSSFAVWVAFLVLGLIQAQLLMLFLGRREEITGRESNRVAWAIFSFIAVAALGWIVAGSTANNEGIMVAKADRIRELDDIEALVERRLGVDNLILVADALMNGTMSEEELEAGAFRICALEGAASEVNLTAQLSSRDIPYTVRRFERADQLIGTYAEEETVCDGFAAPMATLGVERNVLENSANYLVVPIPEQPARLSIPRIEGFNFVGGSKLTLEFTAVLLGLFLYTAAFIAEIVRAGILSVGKGQSEAARALGLSEGQRLQLIVMPQALRVIIPPLTSQYLNLTKNSSLALAVAYPDLWNVMRTIINQSGRSIQPILLTAATYLSFSLLISFFLNWYNRRIQLVER